jgi:hypothetical protein
LNDNGLFLNNRCLLPNRRCLLPNGSCLPPNAIGLFPNGRCPLPNASGLSSKTTYFSPNVGSSFSNPTFVLGSAPVLLHNLPDQRPKSAQQQTAMTDKQSNKVDMYNAVGLFYTTNQAVMDTVTARVTAFGRLNTNRTALASAIGGQSIKTSGSTKDNQLMRANLNTLTYAILQPAAAWATIVENNTLRDQFNASKSDLKDIKDETFPDFCRERLTLVNDNIVALNDYGITPAITAVWATDIDNYDAALGRPRLAVITRSTKTQTIKTLISETGKLLKNVIDPLMVIFQTQDPELFDGYTKSRIIIDRRGQGNRTSTTPKVTLAGLVNSTTPENPLGNATITIVIGTDSAIMVNTDPLGKYTRQIPATAATRTATITATAPGHSPQTRNIIIPISGTHTEDFLLVPTTPPPAPPTP